MKSIFIIATKFCLALFLVGCSKNSGVIKVGVLHSQSGSMATAEGPVLAATLHAIEVINQQGGILGKTIVPIIKDGRSDEQYFAKMARELIEKEQVSAIFGCWTSSSRKAVKEVIEEHDHLLLYPLQYEGLEQSKNIFYLGMSANQQILPAVSWMIKQRGPKFYVVGSDYVFPKVALEIIKDALKAYGGVLTGFSFMPLGSKDVSQAINDIKTLKPDVILNLINGDTNLIFFNLLREAGITPDIIPTMSFSLTEEDVRLLGYESMLGDYTTWSYFQAIDTKENEQFLSAIKPLLNPQLKVFDPMESAYNGVMLWHQAVKAANTWQASAVTKALRGQSIASPSGLVYLDPHTQHAWRIIRIAQINKIGDFKILWSSGMPIEPVPFIPTRPKKEWLKLLEQLYKGWGGHWSQTSK